MSLIKKLLNTTSHKKNDSVNQITEKVIYEQKYSQSHSFKGYKRFNVSYYGYEPAEQGLERFKASGQKLEGADIVLKFVKRGQFNFVDVLINDCLVGSITMWNDDDGVLDYFKKKFCSGKVTKAHIRFDGERVYLFLRSDD